MIRNAVPLRASTSALRSSSSTIRSTAGRRFVSTAPPTQKSRSWKSLFARWALAGGAVYYYNTSPVFAEEPLSHYTLRPDPTEDTSNLETLDSVVNATSNRRHNSILQSVASSVKPDPIPEKTETAVAEPDLLKQEKKDDAPKSEGGEAAQFEAGSVEALEAEAGQEGAFNPETGEINWDCPCLGGMAHGPCGEEFKTAFSCFVYSTEEPKGMDCIDKFKGMQDCFRLHPEIYGAELEDDEEGEGAAQPAAGEEQSVTARAKAEAAKETDEIVPKSAHDTTELNGKAN